jgi:adenylate cyclase
VRAAALIDPWTRRQLRTLVRVVALACVVTPVFNLITDRVSFAAVTQGVVDAFFVATVVGGYLLLVRDGLLRARFRRLPFMPNLLLNAGVVVLLFLVTRGVGQVIGTGRLERFHQSMLDPHLRFALPFFAVFAVALTFALQMNRMVGTSVLGYFLAGTYHQPVEERRIFMFLDMVGSTELAERLGSARYYALLRRFVDDLSVPIVATGGEIYQYAGDEVVITWREDRGLEGAGCVRCFFLIEEQIAHASAEYEREFGVVPRFRAGLHGGLVTAGELGDLKQQIVFVGDILNTAARLEEQAKRDAVSLLVSSDVLDRIALPPGVVAGERRELELRGRTARVGAACVARA